jgi:hypothetical protein
VTKSQETVSAKQASESRKRPFIVQYGVVRCMAYRDGNGTWRDYFHGEEIKGEVKIVSEA